MTLSLSNGNNVNINTMLGNAGTFEILFPMKWKDSYNVRFGGEYDLSRHSRSAPATRTARTLFRRKRSSRSSLRSWRITSWPVQA